MEVLSAARRNTWLILSLFLICFAWPIRAPAKPVTLAYQTPTLSSILPIFVGGDLVSSLRRIGSEDRLCPGRPDGHGSADRRRRGLSMIAGVAGRASDRTGAPAYHRRRLATVHGLYANRGQEGIASLSDLKGKIVGVTGAGGIAEYAAVEGLAQKRICARSRLQDSLRRRQQPGASTSVGRRKNSGGAFFFCGEA